jgi:hypothetical protein
MNTYYLTAKYKILYTVTSALVLLFLYKISPPDFICFGVISIYIIIVTIKSITDEHITLSNSGIEYHRVGLTFHAKWENVREIKIYWFIPFEQEGIFIDPDLIRITEWWLGSYKGFGGWSQKSFIPLSKFSISWRDSEFGQQIKQHAPHLFEQEKSLQSA